MIRRGDLILLDLLYGLVKEARPDGLLLVRLGNGLVVEVRVAEVKRIGPANFAEEMRPDWADPYSPRYRPPPPDEVE